MFKTAIIRISCIAAVVMFCLLTGCKQPDQEVPPAEPEPYQGIIVAMGDSLTAGLGVSAAQGYPEQLKQLLADSGLRYEVIDSGVSGETSSGAKARVDWVLRLKPDIVILETGANDGLRGIDPKLVEENISSILETLLEHDVVVVLAGMQMVTNLGPEYLSAFNRIYPRLASEYPVIFMPFFLKDVAAVPELNQTDGIHPTAEGYGVIAGNLLPYVKQAIDEHRAAASEK
ncbi:MAG: arylesterase [Desulfocapsaceae bacterium]|jgi:acyl-CoA thioesterase-1|nr:arylesterase [Desulfocapsaceae bacterium]